MDILETDKSFYAGINAFGFGGTNAHVLLQNYKNKVNKELNFPQIVLLSHYNMNSLKQYAIMLKKTINSKNVFSILKNLNCQTKVFLYKVAFVANNFEDLINKLNAVSNGYYNDGIMFNKVKKFEGKILVKFNISSYDEEEKIKNYFYINDKNNFIEQYRKIVTGKYITNTNTKEKYIISEIYSLDTMLEQIAKAYIKGINIDLRIVYKDVLSYVGGNIIFYNNKKYKQNNGNYSDINEELIKLDNNNFRKIDYKNTVSVKDVYKSINKIKKIIY